MVRLWLILARFTDGLDTEDKRKQWIKGFVLSNWETELTCTEMNEG